MATGDAPTGIGISAHVLGLLQLQRSAGNSAVLRLMNGRRPTERPAHAASPPRPHPSVQRSATVQRQPTAAELDASYHQAVLDGNWGKAAEALNGFNTADITTRITALSHEQRVALYVGAPSWATPVLDGVGRVDQTGAFEGAVRRHDWTRAVSILARFNDADIATRVAALSGADRTAMRAACPEAEARVRSALLDLDFRAAVAASRWADAAGSLNGFNDADIATRVTALTHDQRIQLYGSAPKRITAVIAAVDLDAAYNGAMRAHDWAQVAIYLNGFNDPDITAKVAALSAGDQAALRAACPEWASRVRSALLDFGYRAAGGGQSLGGRGRLLERVQ